MTDACGSTGNTGNIGTAGITDTARTAGTVGPDTAAAGTYNIFGPAALVQDCRYCSTADTAATTTGTVDTAF